MAEPRHPDPVPDTELLLDTLVRRAAQLDRVGPAPLRRVKVHAGAVTVEIEWAVRPPGGESAAVAVPAPASGVNSREPGEPEARHPGSWTLPAPAVGTFYRSPEPGAKPFVDVGDLVEPGTQIGILEAMKLMNAVEADRPGRVVEVLVPDGTPVEYEQPLLLLVPATAE
ncbi:acetyl-CoA carboxylase biotin carboxyl carrier protein [Rhizohabitans arisaemae]|uniref:acetyl-CoA carboxylase biotin carboxyl carrier protein n=1 Tax=Rhizohabitans arisaemae TaxID=2720610 RepID=UPI0024B19825|nr:biotin/lipoyl-containing protein [Rhizohabitans arisaemae]